MLRWSLRLLLCAILTAAAGDEPAEPAGAPPGAAPSLARLAEEQLPEIDRVVLKGDHPRLIYIPILHDNPEFSHAAGDVNRLIAENLARAQKIAEHLYKTYGIRHILLEGLPKSLADQYNAPANRGRKLTANGNPSRVIKVWFELLNRNPWHLTPACDRETYGPLTLLGYEYNERIQKAFQATKNKGWFRSYDVFSANQAEFTRLIAEASQGYNERRAAVLKADPGLKREYDITVTQRNKVFIDNTLAAEGPGLILCGGGHIQDLVDQFDQRGISYLIVVPRGTAWPPEKKDADTIYREMLKLGCQLSECAITLGDGKSIKVNIPINR